MRAKTLFIVFCLQFTVVGTLESSLLPVSEARQPDCPAVGRVLSQGDVNFPAGRLICMGERVRLRQLTKVNILCFGSGTIQQFTRGQVVSQVKGCGSPPPHLQNLRRCQEQDTTYLCITPKGQSEQNFALQLIQPYGKVTANTAPTLSWHPALKAKRYTIRVEGYAVNWQQAIITTSLPYPTNQPVLQPGHPYRIILSAYDEQDNLIGIKQSVLNVLSEPMIQKIQSQIEQVKRLDLEQDEAAVLDLTSIYLAYGLLDQAIMALESRVQARSQNSHLYRVLGDCYRVAGMPSLAKLHYERAIALAQLGSDSDALAKAERGLANLTTPPTLSKTKKIY